VTVTPIKGNDPGRSREAAEYGTSAVTAVTVTGPAKPKPFYAGGKSTVTVSDLPATTMTKIPFTVAATRRDGVPVCQVEYGSQKFDGSGPFQIFFDPFDPVTNLKVHYCDAGYDTETLDIQPAFRMYGPQVVNLTREHGSKKENATWRITNNTLIDSTVELRNRDRVLHAVSLPANGTAEITDSFPAKQFLTGTTNLILRAIGNDGSVAEWPIILAKGWSVFRERIEPTFTPCSTVTWSYIGKGAPKSTQKMHATTRRAFRELGAETSLKFVEVATNESSADIRVSWGGAGEIPDGVAGTGSPAGDIVLSKKVDWLRDTYAGFAKDAAHGIPGNGWLVIHEALHVLGLAHTDSHGELMSTPQYRGADDFGVGDKAAIQALYQPETCP